MQLPALKAEHDHQTCTDDDCPRFPCRIYKDGYRTGYDDGRAAGFAEGYAAGYSDGEADGYAAGASDR
jgi:hypothetical protein